MYVPRRTANVRRRAAACSLLIAAGGCANFYELSADLRERIAAESDALTPAITDDDAVRQVLDAALRRELPPPPPIELPATATVADLVAAAIARNPRIQARIRDLEALGMHVPQVSSLADPMFALVPPTAHMVQTAAGEMEGAIGISQGVPWPGKLRALGRAAEQVVRLAVANLDSERLQVIAEVKQAHADLYQAQVSLDVSAELETLLQRLCDTVAARVAAGSAGQQDLLRAEVERFALQNLRIDYELQRRTATAALNVLMDRAVDAPVPAPRTPDPAPLQWRLFALLERADATAPQLAALRTAVARDLVAIELAHLQYLPDFSLGGLFTFIMNRGVSPVATGNDIWDLNIGVSLPIWFDKLRSGVLQRNAEALASVLRYRSGRNDVLFALQQLLARADSEYRRAILLRDDILPRVRQATGAAQSAYEAGRADFTALLATWQRQLELQLDYHMTLASLERTVSELEATAGGALARTEPTEPKP